jgi:hypothetical protein
MRLSMLARGRVQNGVVVLDNGVRLPEGQEVTVLAPDTVASGAPMEGPPPPHSVLDIASVRLGPVRRTLNADDDLLGEMLEDRS